MVMGTLVKVDVYNIVSWGIGDFISSEHAQFELHELIYRNCDIIITKFGDDHYMWSNVGAPICNSTGDYRKHLNMNSIENLYIE